MDIAVLIEIRVDPILVRNASDIAYRELRAFLHNIAERAGYLDLLPIGGLREKSMAAFKADMNTVIIPSANVPDLDEIDDAVKDKINFISAEKLTDVLDNALASPAGKGGSQ